MNLRGVIKLFILFFAIESVAAMVDISLPGKKNITSNFETQTTSKERQDFPKSFKPIESDEFHHGYSSDYIWLKAKFTNSSKETKNKTFYFTSLTLGDLIYYELVEGKWKQIDQFDIAKDRDRVGYFPKLSLEIEPLQEREILIRRKGVHHLDTKIFLTTKSELDRHERKTEKLYTFYLGFVVALLIFNFVIFLLTWDKDYLIYTGFIFSVGTLILLLLGAIDGIYLDYKLNRHIGTFSSLSIFFAFYFSYSFLQLKTRAPKAKYFFYPCTVVSFIAIAVNQTQYYFDNAKIFGTMIDLNIVCSMVVLLAIATWLVFKKKDKTALIYLISWLFMFGSGFVWLGVTVGVFPVNFFSRHALLFGNVIEMLVLSSALAYKYNTIKEELRVKREVEKSREKYKKLLRVLSHDIANSLFVISGYAKRFRRRPELFNSEESWAKIEKATIHMERILKTVKAEQAYERDSKNLELEKINLKNVLEDTFEIYSDRFTSKDLNLELNGIEEHYVMGNYSILVHQVFGNIVSNAIKFTGSGGDIQVSMAQCDNYVTVRVKDSGVGISEADLEALKEGRDISSKVGTDGERGTGFGIYLIQSYVKIFNGVFNIKSYLDTGTTIEISIPRV
jgi:signal transduction histidine kinase